MTSEQRGDDYHPKDVDDLVRWLDAPDEPTPPSLEEAEARAALHAQVTIEGMAAAINRFEAAIRRPLEEERDRLRLEASNARAAICGMAAAVNADRAARRAAEAQVAKLREALRAVVVNPMNYLDWLRKVDSAFAETSERDGS